MEKIIYPTYLSMYSIIAELIRQDELLAKELFAEPLRELIYIGMVNNLEAYLQDRLYEEVFSTEEKTRAYVETFNELNKKKKLTISFPLSVEDRKIVEDSVLTQCCHQTNYLFKYFKSISKFNEKYCTNKSIVDDIIDTRNKLVHRMGHHNEKVSISCMDIRKEGDAIARFIYEVEAEFQRIKCNWLFDLNPDDCGNDKKRYSEVDDGEFEDGCVDEDSLDKFVYEANSSKKPATATKG